MGYEERRLAESATTFIEGLRILVGEYREAMKLIERYGVNKFGDEWFPSGDAAEHLDEERAERLEQLIRKLS